MPCRNVVIIALFLISNDGGSHDLTPLVDARPFRVSPCLRQVPPKMLRSLLEIRNCSRRSEREDRFAAARVELRGVRMSCINPRRPGPTCDNSYEIP